MDQNRYSSAMWKWLGKSRSSPGASAPHDLPAMEAIAVEPGQTVLPRRRRSSKHQQVRIPRSCRLDSVPLVRYRRWISSKMREGLARAGIHTVGELQFCATQPLVGYLSRDGGHSPRRIRAWLRHWRTVFKLMAELPELRVVDAVILVAIHRRKARGLVQETPGRLYADVRRYLLSSAATKRVKRHAPPTATAVEGWIKAARSRFQRG